MSEDGKFGGDLSRRKTKSYKKKNRRVKEDRK
jgi:hypothetical protein